MAGINGVSQAFTGTYLPGRCVPLGPHTAPLTPRAIRNGWKNGNHGTKKFGFPNTKKLIGKLSVICEPTLGNIANPVLVEFKEYLLKCAKIF